jgi:pseudaminic acid synthase
MNNLPFFVAEVSANHNGSLAKAKKLIHTAKKNGADAVKIQSYSPSTMTLNSKKFYFKIKKGLWKNYYLWDLYKKAQTPFRWHNELFSYAKKINIQIFSTPFDSSSVDILEKLNCPMYKIASFELTDLPLIKKVALTKKPLILSTGMADLNEITDAVNIARKYGCKNLTLLYCVSNYPSEIKNFNLNNIKLLKKKFKCKVGLSDHSKDNIVAITAVAAGADMIEKHIGLKNQKKGLDIEFSIKGSEIKKFKEDILIAKKLLGSKFFKRDKSENTSKIFRRSILVIEDIKKGDKFTKKNIKVLRPNIGIKPKYFEKIIGKKSQFNFKKNNPLPLKVLKSLKIKK